MKRELLFALGLLVTAVGVTIGVFVFIQVSLF